MSWFDEMVSISTNGMSRRFARSWIVRNTTYALDFATPAILATLSFVRLIRWNDSLEKVKGQRGRVLWIEAESRGIQMRSISVFGKPIDVYEATKNGKTMVYTSVPTGEVLQNDALFWMDDKALLKQKLEPTGVPVARGGSFRKYSDALKRFRELTAPVIVKPRIGSRGRHTFTSIYTEDELKKAFKIAKQLGPHVVMEEHLVGSVYRGTVVGGTAAAVLRGDPPRVIGDGVSTVSQLIETKNATKDPRISDVVITAAHLDFLGRNGITLDTIVPAGKTIDLLEKIGISYGGMSAEVTPDTHPKIFTYLEKAAALVGYPVIGFDFIIEDVSKDPDEQRWGIIEANSAPFVNLHHDPIEGTPVNVAGKVWDYIEPRVF